MGIFGLFSRGSPDDGEGTDQRDRKERISYDKQIEIFKTLGYEFNDGVTKKMILRDVGQMTWKEDSEKEIIENPYWILYYVYGWRDPQVPKYNYSEKCIWFDLEFFENKLQYKWFMERMGAITGGEIEFGNIEITTDEDDYEWISFEVNGIKKNRKLEKAGYIADHFIQRFSDLPEELSTSGKYTYFDDGGQQFVLDYATDKKQRKFKKKTGIEREWLGEGNHFSKPKD